MDNDPVADALVQGAKAYIDSVLAPVLKRLEAIETRAAVAGPPGRDGAEGPPGKDADPAAVVALLRADMEAGIRAVATELIAAVPPPRDGADGLDADPAEIAAEVTRQLEAAPKPRDGRDGAGVTGALIDRENRLVLTLSDGSMRELGVVVGRDADMEALAALIVAEIGKLPKPRDGIDGVGFDDIEVIHDGEREFIIRFVRGEQVREFRFVIPVVLDRGVWREGAFARGDGVTWAGSYWIAQRDTEAKPETNSDWRLSAKRGRDGRHTEGVKVVSTVKASGD